MELSVREAGEGDREAWDHAVAASPNGTLFHTWEFLRIAEKYTGDRLIPLLLSDGQSPAAVFPVYLERRPMARIAFSPPPRTMLLYLGPAIVAYDRMYQSKKESVYNEVVRKADSYLKEKARANYIKVRTSPGIADCRAYSWAGYSVEPFSTYTFDLSDMDALWESFDSDLRRGIEKTEKEGVSFRPGGKEDYDYLISSLERRFSEQGLSTSTYKGYFDDIYSACSPEGIKVFAGDYEGGIVTGLIHACFRDRMSAWIGIPKTNIKGVYPNYLVLWESMCWAADKGYSTYEIMDAGDIERLKDFKAKYNPDLTPWFSAEKYSSGVYRLGKGLKEAFNKIHK